MIEEFQKNKAEPYFSETQDLSFLGGFINLSINLSFSLITTFYIKVIF